MTTNGDGSVNHKGIHTFAESVVAFLRKYEIDGIDIDYEYPTSMQDAGNPADWNIANPRRKGLNKSFEALMKTLEKSLIKRSLKMESTTCDRCSTILGIFTEGDGNV
ncbi:hypothetical protein BLIC30S_04575 [Bacillus licheniformis]